MDLEGIHGSDRHLALQNISIPRFNLHRAGPDRCQCGRLHPTCSLKSNFNGGWERFASRISSCQLFGHRSRSAVHIRRLNVFSKPLHCRHNLIVRVLRPLRQCHNENHAALLILQDFLHREHSSFDHQILIVATNADHGLQQLILKDCPPFLFPCSLCHAQSCLSDPLSHLLEGAIADGFRPQVKTGHLCTKPIHLHLRHRILFEGLQHCLLPLLLSCFLSSFAFLSCGSPRRWVIVCSLFLRFFCGSLILFSFSSLLSEQSRRRRARGRHSRAVPLPERKAGQFQPRCCLITDSHSC